MLTVAAGLAGTIILAIATYAGAKFARRKDKADAAQTLVDTAMSLVDPLKIEVGIIQGRLTAVESENARLVTRVATLEVDNRNLRSENTGLRTRVSTLERQLLDLGHTPVNGAPAVVTTSTTEITTVKQETTP